MQLVVVAALRPFLRTPKEELVRMSLDWWAVLAAAVAIILIKTGLVSGIPW